MLSLLKCREILGNDCPQSDDELKLLLDQMYVMAGVICDAFVKNVEIPVTESQNAPCFQAAISLLPEEERENLEERAAINEFEGGLDRDLAERTAFSDHWRQKYQARRN